MTDLILDPSHTGGLTIYHSDKIVNITIPLNNDGRFPIMWQTIMVIPEDEMINFVPESPEVTIQGSNILTPTQIGLIQNQNGENIWKVTAFEKESRTKIIQETLSEDKVLVSGDPTWQCLTPIADGVSVILSDIPNDEFVLLNGSINRSLAVKKADGTLFFDMNAETKFAWVKRADTEWKILLLQGFVTS